MHRILCFGDSNTYGYPPGGGPRMDAQTRWPCLLGAKLHCQVLEEGVCGRVAFYHDAGPQEQTLRALKRALVRHAPIDGIVLMLGTNDCRSACAPDAQAIACRIGHFVQCAHQHSPKAKVLLIAPPPVLPCEDAVIGPTTQRAAALSRALPSQLFLLAQREGCLFLDAGRFIAVSPVDGVHLDSASHAALAEAVAQVLRARH